MTALICNAWQDLGLQSCCENSDSIANAKPVFLIRPLKGHKEWNVLVFKGIQKKNATSLQHHFFMSEWQPHHHLPPVNYLQVLRLLNVFFIIMASFFSHFCLKKCRMKLSLPCGKRKSRWVSFQCETLEKDWRKKRFRLLPQIRCACTFVLHAREGIFTYPGT